MPERLPVREPRLNILVRATILSPVRQDVCIQNVSSTGMMLIAASPPKRGDYVEIQLKARSLVGYVVWSSERRFGIKLRQRIVPQSLLSGSTALKDETGRISAERYARLRAPKHPCADARHYRRLGSKIEFAFITLLAASAALTTGALVFQGLSRALTPVVKALH